MNELYFVIFTVSGLFLCIAFILYSLFESLSSFFTLKGLFAISLIILIVVCSILHQEPEPPIIVSPLEIKLLHQNDVAPVEVPSFCRNFNYTHYRYSISKINCFNL